MKSGRRDFRPSERQGRTITSPLDIVEGFLDESLAAADDPLTGATMAKGTLIAWSQDMPSSGQDLGDWDADTNDPALSDGSGDDEDFYRVSVAGETALDGIEDWRVGQYLKMKDGAWVRHAPEFYETETDVWLVNRDTSLSGSVDYYFQAAKINGEFRVLWLSCSAVRP